MAITVVVGPPCAGKSTYVREHALPGDVVVDFDLLARALGSPDEHSAPEAVRSAAFAAREAAIGDAIGSGATAWVIHTSPQPEKINAYEDASASFLLLDPGKDECLRRCEADGRPPGTAEAIEAWYADPPALPGGEKGAEVRKTKSFAVKAADLDEAEGTITFYASTFDREPDCYGDVVAKGAFSDTLKRHADTGEPILFLWGHDTVDPFNNIGSITEAAEDEKGLKVTGKFDMDNPNAAYVRKLAQEGRVTKASFAYDVLDSAPVELEDGTKANELRKLDLFEVSLVAIPANRHAEVIDAKSDTGTPALAQAMEHLAKAIERLDAKGRDEGGSAANAEERESANAEERGRAKSDLVDRINKAIR